MAEYEDYNNLYSYDQSDFYQAQANAQNGIATLGNSINAWKTNKTNKEIARETNQYGRETSLLLAEYQANLEQALWEKQLYTNVYATKMEQLKRAGINPFVAAGKVANVENVGSMKAVGAGVPATHPGFYQPYMLPVDSVSGLLSGLAALSQSQKTDEETARLKRLAAGEVEGQYLDNAQKQFNLEMDLAFKGLERNAQLRLVKNNILESAEKASMYAAQGNLASMEYQVADAERYIKELEGQIKEEEYNHINEIWQKRLRQMDAEYEATIAERDEKRASARAHNASAARDYEEAGYINEQTRLANALHNEIVRREHIKTEMSDEEYGQFMATSDLRMRNLLNDAEQNELLTKQMTVSLREALQNQDWQLANQIVDTGVKIVGMRNGWKHTNDYGRQVDQGYMDYEDFEVKSSDGRSRRRTRTYYR